jgi:annexin A7/11
VAILARENLFQLRALSEEYNQLTGHHLDEAIKKEFGGDARDGLTAIVRFARNPRQLFAEWIHQAIKVDL